MLIPLTKFFKKRQENYIRNWKEQDNFEKFGGILFFLIVIGTAIFIPEEYRKDAVNFLFIFSIFYMALMHNRIRKAKRELIDKNKEIKLQKHLVEEHQQEIIDSITYAKRLQRAILPSDEEIKKYFPYSFLLYKPKYIVAGDFYWMEHIDEITFIAAADSTGHGVPGAMVSVVCSNALNRAVKELGLRDTGKILDKTRDLVLETFAKSGEEIKDGMDISLLSINKNNHQTFWSGANNQLWYIKNKGTAILEIKADKQPIGKTDYPKPFKTHQLDVQKGDTIYLITDGYPDQFGGEKGKKFMSKNLKELLQNNAHIEMTEQKALLNQTFKNWVGDLEQVDDVTIIGIKV
jgi:serine phosphatase RsbU (regulator of sigma subunit)